MHTRSYTKKLKETEKKKLSSIGKQNNYKKKKIPKKVKEEVWAKYFNKTYESKCYINWCSNLINVFNFQVGHNIPESKGGSLSINNLKPICDRCNFSMGSSYTIDQWNDFSKGINFPKPKPKLKPKLNPKYTTKTVMKTVFIGLSILFPLYYKLFEYQI